MDKNTFAAYEYLPSNSSGAETYTFFVNENGTFRLDRQVQYVAEIQDENESMDGTQACAVYDVDPQQFYMDVANHPGELIAVPDNYLLPTTSSEEASKLYGNSFLLQTVGSESVASVQGDKDMTISVQFKESDEQEEVDVVNVVNNNCTEGDKDMSISVQFKESDEQEEVDVVNVVNSNCTEITLSDEQYTCLEEKGWVHIEHNGKIYILDAYGLHEVTTKNEVVQNTKDVNKIELPIEEESNGLVKDSPTYPMDVENVESKNMRLEQETVEAQISEQKEIEKEELNKVEINKGSNWEKIGDSLTFDQTSDNSAEQLKETLHPELQKYQTSKIKILTKYNFKDVPDKIVLGRTSNGKKLVAKVVKRTASNQNLENNQKLKPEDDSKVESDEAHEYTIRLINKDESKALLIDEIEYETLVQRAMRGEIQCSPDEVSDASNVISQLLQVPEFSSSVAGRNIIVTKVYKKKSFGESTTSFVSGCVKSQENGHGLLFKHVPDLLKKLTFKYDEYIEKQSTRSVLKPNAKRMPDCKILQVHISESRHNGSYAISFVLKERFLPCTQEIPGLRRSSRLHACSACAAIFRSATELSEHQAEQNHAMDSEDTLTIDTDKIQMDVQTYTIMDSRYYVVNTSKGTEYCCFQCSKRFNKLVNCKRHIKIVHTTPLPLNEELCDDPIETTENGSEEFQQVQNLVVVKDDRLNAAYQCKMCPRTYHHPGSLSKHINKIHIQPSAHRRALELANIRKYSLFEYSNIFWVIFE